VVALEVMKYRCPGSRFFGNLDYFPVVHGIDLVRSVLPSWDLLNHTNYSTTDNGVQDAQFGQILSAAGPGREVRFALKLLF
jgi:hypothetical protein